MDTEAKLIIVNLSQAIKLLVAAVGLAFFFGKSGTCPVASKMEELKEDILELEEDASEVVSSILDGVPGMFITGSGVLLALILLGLVSYMVTSYLTKSRVNDLKMKETTNKSRVNDQKMKETTNRDLLDLNETERWRYIDAKDNGDQEAMKKIVEGMDEEDTKKIPTVQTTAA